VHAAGAPCTDVGVPRTVSATASTSDEARWGAPSGAQTGGGCEAGAAVVADLLVHIGAGPREVAEGQEADDRPPDECPRGDGYVCSSRLGRGLGGRRGSRRRRCWRRGVAGRRRRVQVECGLRGRTDGSIRVHARPPASSARRAHAAIHEKVRVARAGVKARVRAARMPCRRRDGSRLATTWAASSCTGQDALRRSDYWPRRCGCQHRDRARNVRA